MVICFYDGAHVLQVVSPYFFWANGGSNAPTNSVMCQQQEDKTYEETVM